MKKSRCLTIKIALEAIDKEIVILSIKKLAIIADALGEPRPKGVSGPIGSLKVDAGAGRLPTITAFSKKSDDKSGDKKKKKVEFDVEVGPVSIYLPDEDICHDGTQKVCCKGPCPC